MNLKKRVALLLLLVLFGIISTAVYMFRGHSRCTTHNGNEEIIDLCKKFRDGEVDGPLCSELCSDEKFDFKCLQDTNKVVLEVIDIASEKFILKRDREAVCHQNDLKQSKPHMVHSLLNMYGVITESSLVDIALFDQFTQLSLCYLLKQKDWVMAQILGDKLNFVPVIEGHCGPYYKTNYFKRKTRDIQLRQIISFTEEVFALQDKVAFCDVQHSHIYFSDIFSTSAGDIMPIMIDLDLAFIKEELQAQSTDKVCITSSDCNLFDCNFDCKQGKCSLKRAEPNISVFCKKIFEPKRHSEYGWFKYIERNANIKTKQDINEFLNLCEGVVDAKTEQRFIEHLEYIKAKYTSIR